MYLVEPLLLDGFNVCLFDFAGYGNSEGDFVTMGVEEMWDVELVIQHLERSFGQKKFVLWGRSMGAVAALLYLQKISIHENHQVMSAVFDSPFHSLEKLTL
jgi:pimeloyl-ACP methyl ester carboxylesterase